METQKIKILVALLCLNFLAISQETYTYNFTNVSVHLSNTANVTPVDFIKINNQGVPGQHEIRFGLDTYFLDEDILSSHNSSQFFDTGQGYTKAMGDVDASHFYIRITDPIGITRLTLTVNRGFSEIGESKIGTLTLYPNPCGSEIFIAEYVEKLRILDTKGQVLLEINPQSQNIQIDMRNFPQGIYFVLVDDRNWFKLMKI
jgi:hypothetical protein